MKTIDVTVVRIYISEKSKLLTPIMKYLHDVVKVRGVTVFRAISGYGDAGVQHTASLMDLALDLPLTIEFFDHDEIKIMIALEHLNGIIKPEHIIWWQAKANNMQR